MANPTTNYSWPMPTSADLVTDLPADFAAFGQPVDTSLKALNPETTLGDIAFRSSTSNTNTRLGIGTAGQVLAVVSGVPAWTTTSDVTPLTTKGDLFTFTTVDARLGVGANDTVLTADSTAATGLKWAAAGGAAWTSVATGSMTSSSVTVSSLSSAEFLIYLNGVSTSATGQIRMQFNGDTGGNYYEPGNSALAGLFHLMASTSVTSSTEANLLIQLTNCSTNTAKGATPYGTGGASNIGGIWKNASALTEIKFFPGSGTFTAGTYTIYSR